jgi:hypothetical protein
MISHCLNNKLGAYGIDTYLSPDQTSVLINDDTMCRIVDFFNKNQYQSYVRQIVLEYSKKCQMIIILVFSGLNRVSERSTITSNSMDLMVLTYIIS